MTETSPLLSLSLLSGSSPLIKYSRDLSLPPSLSFSPSPQLSSVQRVLLAGILHEAYCQSVKTLQWESHQRGQLSWIKAGNHSDRTTAGAVADWCPVKPWSLVVRCWLAMGIVWRDRKSGDLTIASDRTLVPFLCGPRRLNKERAGERQWGNDC